MGIIFRGGKLAIIVANLGRFLHAFGGAVRQCQYDLRPGPGGVVARNGADLESGQTIL